MPHYDVDGSEMSFADYFRSWMEFFGMEFDDITGDEFKSTRADFEDQD